MPVDGVTIGFIEFSDMRETFDICSGLTLYHKDRPILRFFYRGFDHTKNFFDIVFLDVDYDNVEQFLLRDIWKEDEFGVLKEDYSLVNHLTNSRSGGSIWYTSGGWPLLGNMAYLLYIKGGEQKTKTMTEKMLSFLKRLFWQQNNEESTSNNKEPKNYDFAVLDLRRGVSCYRDRDDNFISSFGTDDSYYKRYPLLISLDEIKKYKTLALALPYSSNSETYHMLRSHVEPKKVIELTLFNPESLEEFLEYDNVKRLFLLYAKDDMSFSCLERFTKLKSVFISGSGKDAILSNATIRALKGGIDITIWICAYSEHKHGDYTYTNAHPEFIRWFPE